MGGESAFQTLTGPIIEGDARSRLTGLHVLHHSTTERALSQMRFDSHSQFVRKGAGNHRWHILLNFMAGNAAIVSLA